jgi:hypothetical protein
MCLLWLLVSCPEPPNRQLDKTSQLQPLENPFLHPDPFSRNVWDLQAVQNRVLIGSGDAWRNTGTNKQKIKVVSYSPQQGFEKEFTVDDEQIHRFVLSGARVFVPGFDPLEDWSLGNFYTLETRCLAPVPCWSKYRTIPFGVHTYDLAEFAGKLYATIGGFDAEVKPGLLESTDGGQTWQPVTAPELLGNCTPCKKFLPLRVWGLPNCKTACSQVQAFKARRSCQTDPARGVGVWAELSVPRKNCFTRQPAKATTWRCQKRSTVPRATSKPNNCPCKMGNAPPTFCRSRQVWRCWRSHPIQTATSTAYTQPTAQP